MRFSNEVYESDVIESLEIINESQKSVEIEQKSKLKVDTVSNIYDLIKQLCSYNKDGPV